MKAATYICLTLSFFALSNAQQRVAPGVPPQQYQDPMQHVPQHIPQQHMQQVPMQQVPQQQQYQMPQQVHHQQQVPVQNMQHQQHTQQQLHGQPQVQHQQHGGHGHHPQAQILNANIAQEKQHIQDHMEVPIDTSKMTDQELQFHYFKMHDADNNNKLDGCELIKSLIHWHEQDADHAHDDAHKAPPSHTDKELEEMVDPILQEMDKNGDGYIEWHEYKSANPDQH